MTQRSAILNHDIVSEVAQAAATRLEHQQVTGLHIRLAYELIARAWATSARDVEQLSSWKFQNSAGLHFQLTPRPHVYQDHVIIPEMRAMHVEELQATRPENWPEIAAGWIEKIESLGELPRNPAEIADPSIWTQLRIASTTVGEIVKHQDHIFAVAQACSSPRITVAMQHMAFVADDQYISDLSIATIWGLYTHRLGHDYAVQLLENTEHGNKQFVFDFYTALELDDTTEDREARAQTHIDASTLSPQMPTPTDYTKPATPTPRPNTPGLGL